MGLREAINNAVTSAIKATGNIPESCTFRRTASAYNTATGTVTPTNTDYTIAKVFFLAYEAFEIDKVSVLGTDVKALYQTSGLSVTPNMATDHIIRSNGQVFNIVRVTYDPVKATTKLQLRSPS